MAERRCPSCRALVADDAEWCGQCFASLREPTASSVRAWAAGSRVRVGLESPADGDGPPSVWRCPTCDAENDLGAHACGVCGTSFGRLFDDAATAAPSISPGAAGAWSLLLPGLGHWFAGRQADAVARFVLAVWIAAMLLVLFASRGGKQGFGSVGALIALFACSAVALWAEAFVDARRAAAGLDPIVSSRMLLWACVGLIALAIALSTVLALSGLRFGGPSGPIE